MSSFSPHVLGLPTLENAIFTVGKMPETLGSLAASHLYHNSLQTYSLLARHCHLEFPLPARRLQYVPFCQKIHILYWSIQGIYFPEIRAMAPCKVTRSLVKTDLKHVCAVFTRSFTGIPGTA